MSQCEGPRVVVDERGEPDRPRAARTLEAELRPAERLRIRGHQRSQVHELATGLGQGEDFRPRSAPAPAPAATQAAGVDDGGVPRFEAHRRRDSRSGAGILPRRLRDGAIRQPGRLLGDRGDGRIRQDAQRRRRDREDRGRQAGRGPHDLVAPEIRIHDHADRSHVADRRDAADGESGQLVRLARRRASDVGGAGDRGQARQVDPVVCPPRGRSAARRRPRPT